MTFVAFRVSSLAYPNVLGTKGYVVVVVMSWQWAGPIWVE